MTDPLHFKFIDTIRPPCSRCGRPLILTKIEPEEPGFDLRTYYCAACADSELIIAAVGDELKPSKVRGAEEGYF